MSEINKTLLRRVRNKLLRVPEAYDQGTWGKRAKTPCGARACIAGHTLLEAGYTTKELFDGARVDLQSGKKDWFDVQTNAAELLGLDYYESEIVFALRGREWPQPFKDEYKAAKNKWTRARAAANYLNYIIRTGKVT